MPRPFFAAESRRLCLVGIGMALGLFCAIFGLIEAPDGEADLANSVVAEVNGRRIEKSSYQQTLVALMADKKQVSADDRQWLLQRLVEEELLVQRSLEIDISQNHKAVRSVLVRAMLDSVIKDADAKQPSETQLQEYYAKQSAMFAPTPRFKVRAWSIHAGKTEVVWELPSGYLSREKLRQYLGPKAVSVLTKMAVGQTSEVIVLADRKLQLSLIDRKQDALPSFSDIRDRVLAAYRRDTTDQALREYLQWLQARADIKRMALDEIGL